MLFAFQPIYSRRRLLMRETWLKKSFLSRALGRGVKIAFFMGKAEVWADQQRIKYESELYKDIVQSDFDDSYHHNTYKCMSYLL